MNSFWETLVHGTTHMLQRLLRRPGFMLISSVTLGLVLGASRSAILALTLREMAVLLLAGGVSASCSPM